MNDLSRRRAGGLSVATCLLAACGGGSGGGNQAPLADAGGAQSVYKNDTVTLTGAGSTDPDGDALSYRWTQTAGVPVVLTDPDASSPSFQAPAATGTLEFSLVVNDGREDSAPDAVSVTIANRTPVAVAGTNLSAGTAYVVTLDGRTSWDPDGDDLDHTWVQKSGPAVVLTDNGNGTARFTTPGTPATLEFMLIVADGTVSASDDVMVVVQAAFGNQTPVADAGSNQLVPRRSDVYLAGYGSDPEFAPVTYQWQQTGGPAVVLSDPTGRFPSFSAPVAEADLEFTLTVSDGVLSSPPAVVEVAVRNFAPYIENLELGPDAPRTLDDLTVAAVIVDPDQDPVTVDYSWARNGVVIAGANAFVLPDSEHAKNDSIMARVEVSDGFESVSGEVSVVIQDSPAVLSATPPTDVEAGETLQFQVTVTDADGDPASPLAIDYGPAGMAVDGDGNVSWLADSPLFGPEMAFNWRLRLADQPQAALAGTVTVHDAGRAYPLRRTGIEIPVYHSGLVVADLDGDGDEEMLVGSPGAVYELARQGAGYAQAWMYPFAGDTAASIGAVAVADIDGDTRQEIYFAAGDTVVRLDGEHRRQAAAHDSQGQFYCRDLEMADLDVDGDLELACLGSNSDYAYGDQGTIVVFDADTLSVLWESADLALGRSLALGNVDADPAIEIVTSRGFVYDGASLANQWSYGVGFGTLVDTGDLDGDGVEEIVGMDDWNSFRGFSAVLRSVLWQGSGSDFDAILVANVDADPAAEILIGDGQWGNVTAWNYVPATNSLSQSWAINSQDHGVTSMAVGDVDGDGADEIVWGSGATSSGEDTFVVAGPNPTIAVEWSNSNPSELDGPFLGARLAEVAPGESLLMFQSPETDNGYGGARLIGLDPATGLSRVSSELGSNWAGAGALDVVDYDLDGIDEILMATANLYNGYFTAVDFDAGSTEWTSPQGSNFDVSGTAITHADMNADGTADFIGMTTSGSVEVYDLLHQSLIWKSTTIQGGGRDVAALDLDADGSPEIIALGPSAITVYRSIPGPVAYVEAATRALSNGSDLVVADTDGDGTVEIYVLAGWYSSPASILRFDAALNPLGVVELGAEATSLHLEDMAKPRRNLVVGFGYTSGVSYPAQHLAGIDPDTGAVVWRSPGHFGSVARNSLNYVDTDADGEREIAFGTAAGMYLTR